MHNHTDWNDFHFFLMVARQGSLNSAAKNLGVNHSTVFRRINALEKKLKVGLFERRKKGYTLTDAGRKILASVSQMEDQIHAIHRNLLGKDIQLSGNLKISTTDTLGYYWLPPYIPQFKKLYPDIRIEIIIKNRYTDLTKREADIVIPAVNRQPGHMVGRKLAPIYFNLYASNGYIDRHGRPKDIKDLKNHLFLLPNETLARLPANRWLRKYIPPDKIAASSDKLSSLYKLAKQGLGIAPLPHYVGKADEDMLQVMEMPKSCHHEIWILTHPDLRNSARIRAFMQYMYEEMEKEK